MNYIESQKLLITPMNLSDSGFDLKSTFGSTSEPITFIYLKIKII
jgi:hypothetical protein